MHWCNDEVFQVSFAQLQTDELPVELHQYLVIACTCERCMLILR